jgi:hypothetical protein
MLWAAPRIPDRHGQPITSRRVKWRQTTARGPTADIINPSAVIANSGSEDLGGEDLFAAGGAGEDRLQRAVLVLGSEDVAGDEGGGRRQQDERGVEEDDQRQDEPGSEDEVLDEHVRFGARFRRVDLVGDEEGERHDDRRGEPEIGAPLVQAFPDFPGIGTGDHAATSAVPIRAAGLAVSVMSRKSSSSDCAWGIRA